ncbi:MAG: hypothetical protein ABR555_11890 [Pyrinomonadaceae bacterium]
MSYAGVRGPEFICQPLIVGVTVSAIFHGLRRLRTLLEASLDDLDFTSSHLRENHRPPDEQHEHHRSNT